jgi:hypothetical protein
VSRVCCPTCRLRFSPLAEAYLTSCPECGAQPTPVDNPESLVGFRLLDPVDIPHILPEALEVSLPVPPYDGIRWTDLES